LLLQINVPIEPGLVQRHDVLPTWCWTDCKTTKSSCALWNQVTFSTPASLWRTHLRFFSLHPMPLVKWRSTVDFDIVALFWIWWSERKGASASTDGIRSSRAESPSNCRTTKRSLCFGTQMNSLTYFQL
jgi:hypothetical protein